MDSGYLKLWRKSLHSGMLQRPELWTFWSWCLMKATYKPRKVMIGFQSVELQPGQFIFGLNSASEELRMSIRKIRTCMSRLIHMENLTIKSTNKFSIISITNWETYQSNECENDNQIDNQVTSKRQASDNKQECKNVRSNKRVSNDTLSCHEGDTVGASVCPHLEIISLYHEILPELPRVKSWTSTRERNLRARWYGNKEYQDIEWWRKFFGIVKASDFLMGRVRDFRASLSWLVKAENFSKVIEGNYSNRSANSNGNGKPKVPDYIVQREKEYDSLGLNHDPALWSPSDKATWELHQKNSRRVN